VSSFIGINLTRACSRGGPSFSLLSVVPGHDQTPWDGADKVDRGLGHHRYVVVYLGIKSKNRKDAS
jgi:hypothetical protein